jgi:predicted nucleotidyltransferase
MNQSFSIDGVELRRLCQRWKIAEVSLFGSGLRDDFSPDSDVDVLVGFRADADWSLLDLSRLERELERLLGRPVDLVERIAVERSENYIRRRHILECVETLYVA